MTEAIRQPSPGSERHYDENMRDPGSENHIPRILIAGIGNVLRGDDGFGPAMIRELSAQPGLSDRVRLVELGIGGIGLVHELMDGYDALILVDAVDRKAHAGALFALEPIVPEVSALPANAHHRVGTDMHEGVPESSLILARAAGVLPPVVRMIGCQPGDTDTFSMELTPPVRDALQEAVKMVLSMVNEMKEIGEPG